MKLVSQKAKKPVLWSPYPTLRMCSQRSRLVCPCGSRRKNTIPHFPPVTLCLQTGGLGCVFTTRHVRRLQFKPGISTLQNCNASPHSPTSSLSTTTCHPSRCSKNYSSTGFIKTIWTPARAFMKGKEYGHRQAYALTFRLWICTRAITDLSCTGTYLNFIGFRESLALESPPCPLQGATTLRLMGSGSFTIDPSQFGVNRTRYDCECRER